LTNWTRKTLAEISDSCLGKMLDKEKNLGDYQPYLANFNVRWGGFDFTQFQKMRFEPREQERYGLNEGDLVVCEGGEPGRCAIWRNQIPNMKIQKALHRVRTKPSYSSEFLYYRMLIAGRSGELAKQFIGSTIKHLTGIGLAQVEFDFPSFAEQQKIAAALSVLDAKIDLNNRINAELEALAKTIYDYWFVQFDFPDANGRPYKSSGGAMVSNDTLKREIPAAWEVVPLGNLVDTVKDGAAPNNSDTTTPYVGLEHIARKSIALSAWSTADQATSQKIAFRRGDILFGKIRPYFHKVAFASFDGIASTDAIIMRPKKSEVAGLVLETVFSDPFVTAATASSTGSKMPRADWNVMKRYGVALPNQGSDTLSKYQDLFRPIVSKIDSHVQQNVELTQLRDWLLPLLMNGQVRVA
jgi:type I restriction enzyme S subunit